MTLILLSFLGGVLTILSPCILPVLPLAFARAEQPFLRSRVETVIDERLYELIRQSRRVGEHTVTIIFLDSSVHAHSLTFG